VRNGTEPTPIVFKGNKEEDRVHAKNLRQICGGMKN